MGRARQGLGSTLWFGSKCLTHQEVAIQEAFRVVGLGLSLGFDVLMPLLFGAALRVVPVFGVKDPA